MRVFRVSFLFFFFFVSLGKMRNFFYIWRDRTRGDKNFADRYSPTLSGAVIACNILNDLEGIALPMYFFGSGTCCSLGGRFACVSSANVHVDRECFLLEIDEKSNLTNFLTERLRIPVLLLVYGGWWSLRCNTQF